MSATYKSPYGTLTLSEDDLLWLGRMCYGEGGIRCSTAHAAVMIYAMINRYLLHPGRQHWSTFLYMLRAFSQPINPRWMRGGDLAEKNKNKDSCSKARLDRREYICQMPWDKIPLSIVCAVEAAKNGSLVECLPELKIKKTRLSNWAAASTWIKIRYPHGVNIDGNWFLEDKELSAGDVQTITDVPDDDSKTDKTVLNTMDILLAIQKGIEELQNKKVEVIIKTKDEPIY